MKTKQFLIFITGICVFAWISAVILDHLETLSGRTGQVRPHGRSDRPPFPDDKARFIHWFLQISDIHVSKFWDQKRVPDFRQFCTENIDVIRPEVVMATGDLTDAKHADLMGSEQYPEEWHQYYQTLKDTKAMEKTVWLDVKGNHDAFNVPSLESHQNYHREFSAQGPTHPGSYRYIHNTADGQKITFIAVDGTPNPGVRRPFNFFGMLSEETLKQLAEYRSDSRSSNTTIWFGHYPSSTLANPRPFRDILNGTSVYLSGHLHTLAGLAPNMYTRAHDGYLELELGDWMDNRLSVGGGVYLSGHLHTFNGRLTRMYARRAGPGGLELELGDWKDNRMYRVLAVDHDLLSFTDVSLGQWPVVLITNPKDAQFITPAQEPTGRMRRSSHIRVLAFSPSPITEVKVTVNGVYLGNARQVEGPLYVLPWQPNDYTSGLHDIEVHVKDSSGRVGSVQQRFTLDDTQLTFEFWRRFILLVEHAFLMKAIFFLTFSGLVSVLILMKVYAQRNTVASVVTGPWLYRVVHCWLRRLYLLTQTPAVFWPLLAYLLYIPLGPWFVGALIDDHLGFMFVYGLYVRGTFLPAAFTWAFGVVQLILFCIPLTLLLARTIDIAISDNCRPPPPTPPSALTTALLHITRHLPLYLVLLIQAWFAYGGTYKAYGIYSLVLGPVRTWSVPLGLALQRAGLRARSGHYKVKHDTNGTASKPLVGR